MKLSDIWARSERSLKKNSPELLLAIGITGVVSTAILAGRGAWQARGILESDAPDMPLKEKARATWRVYIPAGASGVITIAALLGSHRASGNRAAAYATAFAVSEQTLSEYRKQITEKYGENADRKAKEGADAARAESMPPTTLIVPEEGRVLICDLHSRRYFLADIEMVRRAENTINKRILAQGEQSLNDFYYEVGLEQTAPGDHLGWKDDRLLEIEFTSVLRPEDSRPALAIDFNYITDI